MTRWVRRHPGWAAAGLILAVVGALWVPRRAEDLSIFDQPFYLGIAHDIVSAGRFTDGFMFATAGADGLHAPGMRFGPLYPGLLAAAAELDGGLRRGMDCVVATQDHSLGCPNAAPSLRGLQFAELCLVFWLVWWMGGAVGGAAVAWLGLGLALVTTPLLLRSVGMLMTEMTCLALTTATTACGIAALRRQGAARVAWTGLAGVLLGLAVLTRPGFLYLLPASLALLALRCGRRAWPVPGALAAGTCLALAPWLLRNWLVMGQAGLSRYYASHTLVQRIAFDTMDWREYGLAYLCWLPDGTSLGRNWVGPHACDRFGWDDHPDSFYVLGLRHMLPQTLVASGGYAHHLGYLLHTYIFRMPVWHAMVSIPLALRGAYVAHWWGFVLLLVALGATVRAWAQRGTPEAAAFLVLALPAWFMLAFNAAVAVNQVRYNLMLIPPYAVAGGLGLVALWRRHAGRATLAWRAGLG